MQLSWTQRILRVEQSTKRQHKFCVDTFGSEKAQKLLVRVENLLKDDKIREIQSAVYEDAKLGYKSEENSFFGYKTHIAMTDERIITAIEVTTGEAPDGPELVNLIEKSIENGINVNEVLGDTAYSSKLFFSAFARIDFDVKNQPDTLPYQMEICRVFQWLPFRGQDFLSWMGNYLLSKFN